MALKWLAVGCVTLTAAGCTGCKGSALGIVPATGSNTPKGNEPHLVLIYLDDSGSVETSGPSETSRRSEYWSLATNFVRALHPSEPKEVAVGVSTFQVDCDPISDLTFEAKRGILESILQYREGKTGGDAKMRGTSMLAVMDDAEKRISASKPKDTTVVILTDGGTEDQKGGSLAKFKAKARTFAQTAGLHLAIVGITSGQNGFWPRFLAGAFAGHEQSVKLGKNDVDSESVVQWAADQFNRGAGG